MPDLHFDGTVKGEYVVGHDITDLKQAQDALAAREGQLRAIMDGVPAPVAYIDRDERCHYVNRTFLQFFGLTPEQVSVMRLRDVVGHGIYQSAQAMLTRAMEGESTAFDRLVPGRQRRAALDDDPRGAGRLAVRRSARRVRADERHPRPEAGAGSVARFGSRAAPHHGQRAGARVVHRSRLPLSLPQPPQRGMAGREPQGADRPHVRRGRRQRARESAGAAARPRAEGRDGLDGEAARPARRRSERWESVHYAPHRDAEGNVVGIYAVHADIHDQKRNEDELKRANWMLSSHISNTPLAVLEWDRDFRLVRWSPQAENIFGWTQRRDPGHSARRQPARARGGPRRLRGPGRRA